MASVTKDTGWLDRLNDVDNANATTDTGWLSAGVVYSNGFSSASGTPIQYRIVKFGSTKLQLVYVAGIVNNTDTAKIVQGASKAIVTFPAVVKNLINDSVGHSKSTLGNETLSNWGNPVELGVDATGKLNAQSRSTDLSKNELVFVNMCLVINLK